MPWSPGGTTPSQARPPVSVEYAHGASLIPSPYPRTSQGVRAVRGIPGNGAERPPMAGATDDGSAGSGGGVDGEVTARKGEATQRKGRPRPLAETACDLRCRWSGRRDLNPRPLDPQSSALPNCATSRCVPRRHIAECISRSEGAATSFRPDLRTARAPSPGAPGERQRADGGEPPPRAATGASDHSSQQWIRTRRASHRPLTIDGDSPAAPRGRGRGRGAHRRPWRATRAAHPALGTASATRRGQLPCTGPYIRRRGGLPVQGDRPFSAEHRRDGGI